MDGAGRTCLHLGLAVTAFLITLALVAVPGAAAKSPTIRSWQGIWTTNRGTVMLVQRGTQVTGSFIRGPGKLVGHVSDLTLVGTWSQKPTYKSPTDAGSFAWRITRDGRSFTGHWRYASSKGWSGTWRGTLFSLPAL